MKVYSVTVNASPRYPIRKTYQVEATGWPVAIARAVRQYFKEHKHLRSHNCYVSACFISKKLKEGGDDNE